LRKSPRTDEEEKELSRKRALNAMIGDRDIDCRSEDSIFNKATEEEPEELCYGIRHILATAIT
jgi:hypothetical protein